MSKTDPLEGLKCECCGEPAVGVCSTIVPYSAAFCLVCLDNRAQPKWIIDFQINEIEKDENAAEWFLGCTLYLDGEYVSAIDYWNKKNADA